MRGEDMLKDMPRFPEAYRSRANQLRTNVRQGDISLLDVLGNIVAVMERVRIDPTGIQIGNRFRIDAAECRTLGKALIDAFEIFSAVKGRELVVQIRKVLFLKVEIGLPPKMIPLAPGEAMESGLPLIELDADPDDPDGAKLRLQRIHGFPDLLAWLGEDWDGLVRVFDLVIPLFAFSTQERIETLIKPMYGLFDDVLTKCGV
jgi:hypothetical protein